MIDIAKSTDYLNTSKEDHTKVTKYHNMDESIEGKRCNVKYDLIFESYIDPATLRHMSIPTVRQHDATQEAMRRLLCEHNAIMDIVTSSIDKKRFRLPPRETSTTILTLNNVCNSCDQQTYQTSMAEVENDVSTYTSKRVKRSNNDSMYEISMMKEKWHFVPYPKHEDVDSALNRLYGISQLLTSWDQLRNDNAYEGTAILRRKDEVGPCYIDDVEHALLDFHVTSDDWNVNNILSTSNDKEQYCESQDLAKNDKVVPSDASSVSSISFLEQLHVPPPTLLRVTTSTILEEQELIWKQIKQEQHEPCPAPLYNINSVWHHEVTRGHHIRPPLSPQSRHSIACSNKLPSIVTKDPEKDVTPSNLSLGFKTPTPEERKIKGFASELQTLPYTSFSIDSLVCPAHITPTKEGHNRRSEPKSLVAPCVECRAHLQFPVSVTSSLVYCINCGIMASTDLMHSYMEIDEDQSLPRSVNH